MLCSVESSDDRPLADTINTSTTSSSACALSELYIQADSQLHAMQARLHMLTTITHLLLVHVCNPNERAKVRRLLQLHHLNQHLHGLKPINSIENLYVNVQDANFPLLAHPSHRFNAGSIEIAIELCILTRATTDYILGDRYFE